MAQHAVNKADPTWEVVITRGGNRPIFIAGIFEDHTAQTCEVVLGLERPGDSESYRLLLLAVIDALNSADSWVSADECFDILFKDTEFINDDGEGSFPF